MSAAHHGEAYRKLRAAFWRRLERDGVISVPCHRCGRPVYLSNVGREPHSRSVDHSHAVSSAGDLLDVSQWRVSHLRCNNIAKARPGPFASNGHVVVPVNIPAYFAGPEDLAEYCREHGVANPSRRW
jgi:hypothetical protein